MKKVILSALFFVALAFTACQKCSTCSYSYKLNGKDSTVTYGETCGNSKDIEQYESGVKSAAAINGGKVECTSK